MSYTKSFTAYTTVRSVSTGGFVYIYLRVTATIDGQTNRVISANSVTAYQQDVSRNFVKWQQTGIEKSCTSNSVYGKVKGYCYFKDSGTGVAEKKPFTLEKKVVCMTPDVAFATLASILHIVSEIVKPVALVLLCVALVIYIRKNR